MREEIRAEAQKLAEKCREIQDSGMEITLNGHLARISGFKQDFARISDRWGLSAEWSWHATYNNLTKNNGKFETT